jgi:hypothetical protein
LDRARRLDGFVFGASVGIVVAAGRAVIGVGRIARVGLGRGKADGAGIDRGAAGKTPLLGNVVRGGVVVGRLVDCPAGQVLRFFDAGRQAGRGRAVELADLGQSAGVQGERSRFAVVFAERARA